MFPRNGGILKPPYLVVKAYLLVKELPILENGKWDNVRIRELLDSVNV